MITLDEVKTGFYPRNKSNPPAADSAVAALIKDYSDALQAETHSEKMTPLRILYLRPSQLPFCPIEFFINHAGKGLYRSQDLASAFYTAWGTVVHSVLQRYIPKRGNILGNYECRECGKIYKHSYKTMCCDFPTQYHEIEISYKGVRGHIDAIYRYNGKLYILDFKTTSINSSSKKKKDPGIVYREQIETYAYLYELQYGERIEGIMDAFVIRDNPHKDPVVWYRPFTDKTRTAVRARLTKYKRMHRDALDASNMKEGLALLKYGRCANPHCAFCTKWKSDDAVRNKLKESVKVGLAAGNLPIRSMAKKAMNCK